MRQFVTINNEQNSQRIPISPEGVWRSRVADTHSRDIFFVALARSLGIPAYIDKVDGRVKYITPSGEFPYWGKEIAVDFDSEKNCLLLRGITGYVNRVRVGKLLNRLHWKPSIIVLLLFPG